MKYGIHTPNDESTVADWVELYVAVNDEPASRDMISSAVEDSSMSEPTEEFISGVVDVLRTRQTLYGKNAPYEVRDSVIYSTLSWTGYPEYMACLIFALEGNPNSDVLSSAEAGKLFERLCIDPVENYFGGSALLYGFPTTVELNDVVRRTLGERFIYDPPSTRKDRNLDMVVWKPFEDDRSCQLVALIQCAAGSNWKLKLKELNLEAWCKYVHWAARPIKGFTIPAIIENEDDMHEHGTDAGIIFDRARLYRHGYGPGRPVKDVTIRTDLLDWCTARLSEMQCI
ncbi:MAG TPA: hypothetical protein PLV08_03125 [Flavobacteriales bacterium]|jgi:hypothetical protein|nr:hypothetical protein [Flavobacteriales bacterium]HQX98744.1 hypothetical protein [Flavobacteriales bacterium]